MINFFYFFSIAVSIIFFIIMLVLLYFMWIIYDRVETTKVNLHLRDLKTRGDLNAND